MNELFAKYGGMILTFAIWAAVFYFLLILPNKKKQKKHQEMLDSLKEGAEVVTTGGIKGTISSIGPEFLTIRIDKGVNIQVLKNSISRVLK
ncbi:MULTISPECIES: preprotein translocase subunit YajC [Cetobacterium]|jgi:preprotein translocase subunit YajC|uniref:Preprotein translocase subunit YajC n=1 Tax=Candidatus Cetobacterium colombiensis TaxID=3073100 RepID=A0ABU4WDI0_9FUSO|nr:preprotein translocase subunit YajC [Candidatus Cetobacterium colombiensis]MDX8336460.1 preprotein translocase subunit YajC [Candidatus Cetobacterium colombiensis]